MDKDRHQGEWWLASVAALQFLTRLPIAVRMPNSQTLFRRSTIFFPAAGFIIGGIVAGAAYGLSFIFPDYVNAILLVSLWVLLTGGLHLDGLMDTADGLLSHRSRDKMLEIMKDSRVGAMGVIACVLYLLLKTSLVTALLAADQLQLLFVLVVIPMWSRAFMVMAMAGWPYARQQGGLGSLFGNVRGQHAILAGMLAALITLAVFLAAPEIDGILTALIWLGVMILITYAAGAWLAASVSRKLGGLTGDIYGALNELVELLLLLTVMISLAIGGK